MKRLAASAFAMMVPALVQAACTGDLPGSGVMSVYMDATTTEGVIGGIGANQCGLEVTDFCDNGRCLAFFDGLSGYIDVTGLASGKVTPPTSVFEYQVSDVDGALSFMGRTQPFEMNGNEPITVTPATDHVLLDLPDPLPKNIRLTSTGSSGWEGVLPDWVGVPIPVRVYLDRLSAPEASLELLAEHQLLKMDMRLRLARVGELPDTAGAQPVPEPIPGESYACDKTYELAVAVGAVKNQARIEAYYAAVAAVGITDWENRTEAQCVDLLAELERVGISDTPIAGPAAPQASCDALAQELRKILRGPVTVNKRSVLSAMVSLGITSIDATNPKHCAEMASALGR